jgi:hypothetical protein
MADSLVTLFVETPNGVFVRRIMPASLLPANQTPGPAAEVATRNAASLWGLPDFVFRPGIRRRGSGTRELGDAILVVGDRAACVQVKARLAPSKSAPRERAWLDKNIAAGVRQGAGTIRSMRVARPALLNGRGRTIQIDGASKAWLSITVVDHPGVDGYIPSGPSVVLLRRDWEFLFAQLKSTYAVLEYLQRVGRGKHAALGNEPVRYYQLAAADLNTPKGKIDPRLAALGGDSRSVPLLPMEPTPNADVIRGMLEDIAVCEVPEGTAPSDVLDVLAAIDAAPVAYRAELGKDILIWLEGMVGTPADEVQWQFRKLSWPDRPHLIFGAASHFSEVVREAFGSLVSLRHQQHVELMPERGDLMTVGILLTPRHDGRRPWDTTMVATRGEQGLDPDLRSALEKLWGPYETRYRRGTES